MGHLLPDLKPRKLEHTSFKLLRDCCWLVNNFTQRRGPFLVGQLRVMSMMTVRADSLFSEVPLVQESFLSCCECALLEYTYLKDFRVTWCEVYCLELRGLHSLLNTCREAAVAACFHLD